MQDIVLDNIKFPTGEEKDGARFRQIQEERLNRNFRRLLEMTFEAGLGEEYKQVIDDLQTDVNALKNGTFENPLDVIPRRAYGRIINTGWYRILQFDADTSAIVQGDDGFLVDVTLVEWARQIHKITLAGVLGKLAFVDEFSFTQHNYFDKIRYTQNGTHGYIDVHFSGNNTSNRYQSAFFEIKSVHKKMQQQFTSVDFDAVADAPSGETILLTYSFATQVATPLEYGTTGSWRYRKWSDGRIEIWGVPRVTFTLTTVGGGGGVYHRGTFTFDLPFTLSDLETLQMTAYKDTLWYCLQNFTNGKTVSGYGYDVVDSSNYSTYVSVYAVGILS